MPTRCTPKARNRPYQRPRNGSQAIESDGTTGEHGTQGRTQHAAAQVRLGGGELPQGGENQQDGVFGHGVGVAT